MSFAFTKRSHIKSQSYKHQSLLILCRMELTQITEAKGDIRNAQKSTENANDNIVVIEQSQCLLSDNVKRYKHKFISISINPNAIIFANG